MNNKKRNLIGITMGDPCGIGPDVILKALSSQDTSTMADFVVIGSEKVFCNVAETLGLKLPNGINFLDIENISIQVASYHKPSPEFGRASVEYVLEGIRLATEEKEEKIDALVTAPISKEAVTMAGFEFGGHTELLKEKTNSEDVVMLMAGRKLKVAFVTTHLAIKDVPHFINQENVFSTIRR